MEKPVVEVDTTVNAAAESYHLVSHALQLDGEQTKVTLSPSPDLSRTIKIASCLEFCCGG
jgi:hypothetical protein